MLSKEKIDFLRNNLSWLKSQLDNQAQLMQTAIKNEDEEYLENNEKIFKNLIQKTKLEFQIMYKIFLKDAPNHDITKELSSYILMLELEQDND